MTPASKPSIEPFIQDESGIQWLRTRTRSTESDIKTLYLLNILTNHVQDHQQIYRRLPPEGLRGLQEGGRRNVAASFLVRASTGASAEEQQRIRASGYTELEERIGNWAEKDECWEDYADSAQKRKNRRFLTSGSESNVYLKDGFIYKVTDCNHNDSLARTIDQISLFNTIFPESAVTIIGFGMKDDATDHKGFSIITKQQHFQGSKPSKSDIADKRMKKHLPDSQLPGMYTSENGLMTIHDMHELNAVKYKDCVFVYDCDIKLNTDTYTIPDIKWNNDNVIAIDRTLDILMPEKTNIHEIIDVLGSNNNQVKDIITYGRSFRPTECTINGKKGRYIFEKEKDGSILAQTTDNIAFMLDSHTDTETKKQLSEGNPIITDTGYIVFDIAKGRPDKIKGSLTLRKAKCMRTVSL